MNSVSRLLNQRPLRAYTITVCSGKGGTGKTTIASLLARSLAEFDQRVVLVDCDFGIGDVATLANVDLSYGSEDFFVGAQYLDAVTRQLSPNLWLIGTKPGASANGINETASLQRSFDELEQNFDVVIFDTAAVIDGFTLQLIAHSDRCLTVTSPRISAIADTYAQLKQAKELIADPNVSLIINQALSEVDGEHAMIKFIEMAEKFLNLRIDPLLTLPLDPQLTHLADNQGIYRSSAISLQSVKNLHRAAKTIQEKEISKPRKALSLASHASGAIDLKSVAAFDDREVTVHSFPE